MSNIAFNSIPDDLRVPLAYVEFDNTRAVSGPGVLSYAILVFGQRLAAGQVPAGQLTRIMSKSHAEQAFGVGSMLAAQFAAFKGANTLLDTWAIALDDDAGGVAATGNITFAVGVDGLMLGMLTLWIAGTRVRLSVTAADTADTLATRLIAAINALPQLPVTAAAVVGHPEQVGLTCKWKGETGNDIDLRTVYNPEDRVPTGLTVTLTPMANGAGNPDITTALGALGDTWWQGMVIPYTDTANRTALKTELDSLWGPLSMKDATSWMAMRGTEGETATFGATNNTQHFTITGTGLAPTPPWVWSAATAGICNGSLQNDPARPLQDLVIPGILPPAHGDRFDFTQRQLLLHDGIATYDVAADGTVSVERQITTYQTNVLGAPDESYLDVETPRTLSYLRWSLRTRVQLRFPRCKLMDDPADGSIPNIANVVTPGLIRTEILSLFRDWQLAGLVEDFAQFAAELVIERDANNVNRVNVLLGPNLANALRIFAAQIQFLL